MSGERRDLRYEGSPGFLENLARAAASGPRREAPHRDPEIIRTGSEAPTRKRFIAEATTAGMEARTVLARDLSAVVAELAKTVPEEAVLLEPALLSRFPDLGDVPGKSEATRDELFAAEIGIVLAAGAIAETGSIVLSSGRDAPRGFSLAPMTLVAVVEAGGIVRDLLDWLEALSPRKLAANTVLVTGPSKTADIQMKLVTGVHGPGIVKVLVVEPDPS